MTNRPLALWLYFQVETKSSLLNMRTSAQKSELYISAQSCNQTLVMLRKNLTGFKGS
jgi:hypothetical protein